MNIEIFLSIFFPFLAFAIVAYGLYPEKIVFFRRFDSIFGLIIIFFFVARIIGMILNISEFSEVDWSLSLAHESGNTIVWLSTWPWIIFRFWDGILDLNFFFLEFVISIFLLFFFFGKRMQNKFSLVSNFSIALVFGFTIYLLIDLLVGHNLLLRDISFLNFGQIITQLIINVLILLLVFGVNFYNKKFPFFILIFIFWGIFNLAVRISMQKYEPQIGIFDFYYVESILLFVLSLGYLLLFVLKDNLSRVNKKPEHQGRQNRFQPYRSEKIDYRGMTRNRFENRGSRLRVKIAKALGFKRSNNSQ